MSIRSNINGLKIISSYPGPGTVETMYIVENGGVWICNIMPHVSRGSTTTAEQIGRIIDNRIYPWHDVTGAL